MFVSHDSDSLTRWGGVYLLLILFVVAVTTPLLESVIFPAEMADN